MKIGIVTNQAYAVWQLRREFVSDLLRAGHDVTVVTPEDESLPRLRELGIAVTEVPLKRYADPVSDLFYIGKLYRTFRRERFDIVYTISVKPNIYGTISARLAGVPKRFGLVCGLGTSFLEAKSFKQRCIGTFVRKMYRLAGRCTDKFVFQNDDDRRFMVENDIVAEEKTHVVRSSGINFDMYSPERIDTEAVAEMRRNLFGVDEETIVVGVLARAIESKGVREFIECSRAAEHWGRKVRFIHVGGHDPGDLQALSADEIKETKMYKWVGFRSDVQVVVQAMDVLALPSSYREGVPRSLIEGMALYKPIVTTDNVGCRETVDHGVNGFLVPVRDAGALTEAVRKIVLDDELRIRMGKASRAKAEREFDVRDVNRRIIEEVFGLKCTNNNESCAFGKK